MPDPDYPGLGRSSNDRSSSIGGVGAAGLESWHPSYNARQCDWTQMRDTWIGQRAVKARTTTYLPATSGMYEDGMEHVTQKGYRAYQAYLMRALFHSFVSDAVDTMMGMMWNKPPRFDLPESKQMDYLRAKATVGGEGLEQLLRAINRQQLITGRLGLLTDLPTGTGTRDPEPYIALYEAESIINWDAGFRGETSTETTNLVVLNESGPRRPKGSIFQWEECKQYRVLLLGSAEGNEGEGTYRFGVFSSDDSSSPNFDERDLIEATSRGKPFDHIPWVFINANSTISEPCDPPLLGLSDLCLALYRIEADYRQALFMQTQDTLFTKGWQRGDDEKPIRVGAGGHIHSSRKEADAKYIGVTSVGLPELRTARDNDMKVAASKAGELMDASSRARESGTALEMRIGSKTATMNEIAISGAEGMQRALRDVAQWMGIKDIEAIRVVPNTEFASREFAAQDFKYVVETKMLGGPVSWEAIHKWSAERGGPGKDLTFKEMMEQIEAEALLQETLAPMPDPAEDGALELKQEEHDQKLELNQESHDQKLEMNEESQAQKLKAAKETAAVKKKTAAAAKKKVAKKP